MSVEVNVIHEGETFSGQIMRIRSTSLGYEDHGILTAWLHCQAGSSGVGVGGYCLDEPKDRESRDYTRIGTAYGLDHIIRIIETAGVDKWEKLPGTDVIVLYKGRAGWGGQSIGFAGLSNDKVFIMAEHAEAWKTADEVSS